MAGYVYDQTNADKRFPARAFGVGDGCWSPGLPHWSTPFDRASMARQAHEQLAVLRADAPMQSAEDFLHCRSHVIVS